MYDTIGLRLYTDDMGVNPLEVLPPILTDVSEHTFNGGDVWLSGYLGNLTITANRYQVRLKEGSLCRWWLGDNFKILNKHDARQAIEALGDTLNLPIERADVTRLDVSANVIVKHPVSLYLDHLGQARYYKRLQEPDGLYYTQSAERLCIYDKIAEQKRQAELIPELYQSRNVLRYEQRYQKRMASRLNLPEIKASTLWNDEFYKSIVRRWHNTYKAIQKQKEIQINMAMVNTKKDFYRLGVLALAELAGGERELIEQINDAQKKGLTSKQAYDLRQAVREACKVDGSVSIAADEIRELDQRIGEVAKIYG